jgi:hypothetical protein
VGGQQRPEELVAALPAVGTQVREAPPGICLRLLGRLRRLHRSLLLLLPRLRWQKRGEGVGVPLPRRGEAAAAAQAHDGVQVPVVEAALLFHRQAEWLGSWPAPEGGGGGDKGEALTFASLLIVLEE